MNDRFLDPDNGGYYNSAAGARDLIARRKDIYDGAIPSGNSINITNLVRLARLTGRRELEAIAQRNLDAFSAQIANYPAGFAEMLCGLDFVLGPSHEVVIAGAPDESREMLGELRRRFLPRSVVIYRDPAKPAIDRIAKFAAGHEPIDERTAAYVCSGFACQQPTTDIKEMLRSLRK